ncbi:MAG: tetratricopeptide repeat protein [Chloroflexi bacterium]|nr:tetratricopeptide repeat protein [Chloroflexota bacterium]MBU1749887.1 tetratricopeptide repeat protein [Chloroflexota bacterium]MBU1879721.1 tetratricopeptide repeat protein [Chloroflexota bacterium]
MSLDRHLDVLEDHDLIRLAQDEPELEYLFRHALVQEAAYDSLLRQERRQLHRAVGQVLEELYPARREELAATLAHHFFQAGDDQQALKYFALAGDVAYRQYAVAEAATHYARALEIARRLGGEPPHTSLQHLYTHLGQALELNARYDQALDTYAEMEDLAHARGDRALELAAVLERARVHSTPNPAHDPDQGRALAARALVLAGQLGDRAAEARIHWIIMLNWPTSDLVESLAHGEQSLALARELDLREQLAYTLQDMHRVCGNLGQTERAHESLAEARGLWRELGNLPMLSDCLNSTADMLFAEGDYDQALAFATEALELSTSIGNQWNLSFAQGIASRVYRERGLMDQAFQSMQESIAASERAGLMIMNGRTRLDLALTYGLIGAASERARRIIDQVHAALGEIDALFNTYYRVVALAFLAQLEVRIGNLDAAQESLRQLKGHTSSASLQARAELTLAQGDPTGAIAFLDQLMSRGQEQYRTSILADAWTLRGRALLAQGDLEAAEQALHEALVRSRTLMARHKLWRILHALSDLESRRGDPAAAADYRRQAQEVVEFIARHISAPDLRASFLDMPEVRAVRES